MRLYIKKMDKTQDSKNSTDIEIRLFISPETFYFIKEQKTEEIMGLTEDVNVEFGEGNALILRGDEDSFSLVKEYIDNLKLVQRSVIYLQCLSISLEKLCHENHCVWHKFQSNWESRVWLKNNVFLMVYLGEPSKDLSVDSRAVLNFVVGDTKGIGKSTLRCTGNQWTFNITVTSTYEKKGERSLVESFEDVYKKILTFRMNSLLIPMKPKGDWPTKKLIEALIAPLEHLTFKEGLTLILYSSDPDQCEAANRVTQDAKWEDEYTDDRTDKTTGGIFLQELVVCGSEGNVDIVVQKLKQHLQAMAVKRSLKDVQEWLEISHTTQISVAKGPLADQEHDTVIEDSKACILIEDEVTVDGSTQRNTLCPSTQDKEAQVEISKYKGELAERCPKRESKSQRKSFDEHQPNRVTAKELQFSEVQYDRMERRDWDKLKKGTPPKPSACRRKDRKEDVCGMSRTAEDDSDNLFVRENGPAEIVKKEKDCASADNGEVQKSSNIHIQSRSLVPVGRINYLDKLEYSLTLHFIVFVYKGDILRSNVDSICCGQDPFFQSKSYIAGRIIKRDRCVIERLQFCKETEKGIFNVDFHALYAKSITFIITSASNTIETQQSIKLYFSKLLKFADDHKIGKIALPLLLTEDTKVPIKDVARMWFESVTEFLKLRNPVSLSEVHFVEEDDYCIGIVKSYLDQYVLSNSGTLMF